MSRQTFRSAVTAEISLADRVRALIAECGVIIMSSPENRTFIGGQIKDRGGEEGEQSV